MNCAHRNSAILINYAQWKLVKYLQKLMQYKLCPVEVKPKKYIYSRTLLLSKEYKEKTIKIRQ